MIIDIYLHNYIKYKDVFEADGKKVATVNCFFENVDAIISGVAIGIAYRNCNRFVVVAKNGREVVSFFEMDISNQRKEVANLCRQEFLKHKHDFSVPISTEDF